MISFDESSGNFGTTEMGRVASHYYIDHRTIETFNGLLKDSLSEPDILNMAAQASEFENIMLREEEMEELDRLAEECPIPVKCK